KKVQGPQLPEVNEEFAKSLGVEGGVDALREEIKQNMSREVTQAIENKVKQQVMDKLLEKNEVTAPAAMIEQESKALAQQMMQQLQGQGMDPKMLENASSDIYKDQAERRVKLGLILSEVIKAKDIKASEDEVRAHVDELASAYEQPQEVIDWYYGDKNRLSEVESLVLERKIVEWVLQQAKVSDKQMSVSDLMGSQQQ
ncbi:MAG: trigger factor, partial [Gammaproteobacteria bacterium]|nr:trigger factor [Gammaproteobacteria bacterium]